MTEYKPSSISMTPTLVIGVGGSGVETMRRIKARVRESLGHTPLVIEYLGLDTEPRSNPPGAERIAQREYAYLGDYNATKVLDNKARHPHIERWWFSGDAVVTGSIYKGARQRRPVGRLSLFVNWGKFNNLLETKATRIREVGRKEKEQKLGAEVERHTGQVKVYIVGSVCGGTGSGIFMDVAFKVRQYFGDNADISAIFMLPSCFTHEIQSHAQKRRIKANAYAAMRELNAFLNGKPYTDVFPDHPYLDGEGAAVSENVTRPFDMVYLIDRSNNKEFIGDIGCIFSMIAQYVFMDIVSPIGGALDSQRANLQDLAGETSAAQNEDASTEVAQRLMIATFVTASLMLPMDKLRNQALYSFFESYIQKHLLKPYEITSEMKDTVRGRLDSMYTQFRFEKPPKEISVDNVGDDDIFGEQISTGGIELGLYDIRLREQTHKLIEDIQYDYRMIGLKGMRDILAETKSQLEGQLAGITTETANLIRQNEELNTVISEPIKSVTALQGLWANVMKTFSKGKTRGVISVEQQRRERENANRELQTVMSEQRRSEQSATAFRHIIESVDDLIQQVDERIVSLTNLVEDIQNIRSSGAEPSQKRYSTVREDLFELATEIDLDMCLKYLDENHLLSKDEPAKGLMTKEAQSDLHLDIQNLLLDFNIMDNPTGTTVGLMPLTQNIATGIRKKLEAAFDKGLDAKRLRILDYLDWFYRTQDYDGHTPRFTPIDPLQMLQDRCQYPFLETEPAVLGSEHTSDTEDVRLIGIDATAQNGSADSMERIILEDFDSDTYREVVTGVPERIDLLFSTHGYPMRVLRDLDEFKQCYDYYMYSKKEKLHLHKDWPSDQDMPDLMK